MVWQRVNQGKIEGKIFKEDRGGDPRIQKEIVRFYSKAIYIFHLKITARAVF